MAFQQVTMRLPRLFVQVLPFILLLGTGRHTHAEPKADPPTDLQQSEPTLASFAGGHITVDDLQAVLDKRPRSMRAQTASTAGRQRLLTELVDYDLLALEAERRGYRQRAATAQAAKRAAVDALMAATLQGAEPDPSAPEVATYFAQHVADFTRPALRRASHIQVETEAEARALIASLRGATREQFAAVARARSLDARTQRQGGELGFCEQDGRAWEPTAGDACPPAITQAVFAVDTNGAVLPEPVAHDAAFSVVMYTGQLAAKAPTLERVRGQIVELLAKRTRTERVDALLARLRAALAVETHPELLGQIVLPTAAPSDLPAGFPAAPPDPRQPPKALEPDGI
jgi:peptidyl-prolyl cis-trans isomerase C